MSNLVKSWGVGSHVHILRAIVIFSIYVSNCVNCCCTLSYARLLCNFRVLKSIRSRILIVYINFVKFKCNVPICKEIRIILIEHICMDIPRAHLWSIFKFYIFSLLMMVNTMLCPTLRFYPNQCSIHIFALLANPYFSHLF